jgi:hypothetical protein
MDRTVAEDALAMPDRGMIHSGSRRVADGPYWYSHRFAVADDQFPGFMDRLPS